MDNQTTGSATASGDSAEPDFRAKYDGLQSAFQKRTNEWSAKEAAWAEEREQLEAKAAKAAEYEAREAAEREEAEALAQYEQLSERFRTDPPAPQNPNESSHVAWDERYPRKEAAAPRTDPGFPI